MTKIDNNDNNDNDDIDDDGDDDDVDVDDDDDDVDDHYHDDDADDDDDDDDDIIIVMKVFDNIYDNDNVIKRGYEGTQLAIAVFGGAFKKIDKLISKLSYLYNS